MIQINLSEKQAREFCDFCFSVTGVLDTPIAREVFKIVERQLLPHSSEQAALAVWRSERVLPNLIEAWRRKNETSEKSFGQSEMFSDITPSEALKYSVNAGGALYNEIVGKRGKVVSVNGRSGRF